MKRRSKSLTELYVEILVSGKVPYRRVETLEKMYEIPVAMADERAWASELWEQQGWRFGNAENEDLEDAANLAV